MCSSETREWVLGEFGDPSRLSTVIRTIQPGVNADEISLRLARAARRLLDSNASTARAVGLYVPGRIEMLGKHTDYAGGTSLTCASTKAFTAVATETDEPGLRLEDESTGNQSFISYQSIHGKNPESWALYPAVVVRRAVSIFGSFGRGVSIVFSSDIPRASGLSSSSAFVVTVWLALDGILGLGSRPEFTQVVRSGEDFSDFLGAVESGNDFGAFRGVTGVGTQGGSQDHTAVLYSRAGRVSLYEYRPLRKSAEYHLPDGYEFVIASSGVKARKALGAKKEYNRAVDLALLAKSHWSGESATLRDVVTSPDFSVQRLRSRLVAGGLDLLLVDAVMERVRQFKEEVFDIIPAATMALREGDMTGFGEAVRQSQQNADDYLGNQVPETRFLASVATELGAVAASSFGAGFGGSVWALVRAGDTHTFIREWMSRYGNKHPDRLRRAFFFPDHAGPGALVVGIDPLLKLQTRPENPYRTKSQSRNSHHQDGKTGLTVE